MLGRTGGGLIRLVGPAASKALSRRGSPVAVNLVNGKSQSISTAVRSLSSLSLGQSSSFSTETSATLKAISTDENITFDNPESKAALQKNDAQTLMAEYESKKAASLSIGEYEEFLGKLSELRAFEDAYKMYQDMKAAGVTPTARAYGCVLKAGRRTLRVPEIRELFGQVLSSRSEEAAGKYQNPSIFYGKMKEVMEAMRADGLELETWFWDDCAFWLSGINHAGLLINLAIAQEARGLTPSVVYYTRMLYSLPRAGFADRADVLFSRMCLNGLADMDAHVIRLGSLVYLGRFEEAEQLFAEMQGKFPLTGVAYNTIIHGYLEAQKFDKAFELLEQMKASTTAPPNSVTACTFLAAFYSSGRLERAGEVLQYFKEAIGFPSSNVEKAALLKFYGRYEPSQASRLLQEQLASGSELDIDLYNAILAILTDRLVSPDWKRILGDLVVEKAYPLKAGGVAELCPALAFHVRHTISRMEAFNVAPSASTYDILLRSLISRKDYLSTMRLYNMISRMPSVNLYSSHHNAYLSAMILGGETREAIERFLATMRVRRYPVSSANNRRLAERNIEPPAGAFVYTHDRANTAQHDSKPNYKARH